MKNKLDNNNIATKLTETMATWRFIIVFLLLCLIEILLNKFGITHFDPDTWYLNLTLSLIAAIQGSIIMIDGRQAEKNRDSLIGKIKDVLDCVFRVEKKVDKEVKELTHKVEVLESQNNEMLKLLQTLHERK